MSLSVGIILKISIASCAFHKRPLPKHRQRHKQRRALSNVRTLMRASLISEVGIVRVAVIPVMSPRIPSLLGAAHAKNMSAAVELPAPALESNPSDAATDARGLAPSLVILRPLMAHSRRPQSKTPTPSRQSVRQPSKHFLVGNVSYAHDFRAEAVHARRNRSGSLPHREGRAPLLKHQTNHTKTETNEKLS
jgi:hypothetical protein